MRQPALVLLALALVPIAAGGALARSASDWKVQAGKRFQKAGEYTVLLRNTRFQDAIEAWGRPSSCRLAGSSNHAVATWAARGIRVDLWTYDGLPAGKTGCTSPDLISVSEIRLGDRRWTTAFGLHVGDSTAKLRRLYPRAPYRTRRRGEYWLVTERSPCIGRCTPYEETHGVVSPRLSAEVRSRRVVAFWVPVFGQGE